MSSKDTVLLFKVRVLKFCPASVTRELEGLLVGLLESDALQFMISPQPSWLRRSSTQGLGKVFYKVTTRW